ncbi:MAG: helix-turn-helix transcriptional regulator [Leptolyngbya sp. SIOISBB]|nr:helix-turn-helix transcriptional regulator [Leptolyngbya sp. SIOISBB]
MAKLRTIVGERRTYSDAGHSHCHDYAQLILPLVGTLFLETPRTQLEIDESSVFLIPAACQHHFYARDQNEFLTLDIPAHLIDSPADTQLTDGIRTDFEERWRALRTLLLADLEAPQSTHSLLYLVQYIRDFLMAPSPSRSLQYLHQHYHQPLSIAHLAQLEGYTLSYYSEWFKGRTGQSPKDYVNALRLQQAKHLLEHTDLPIFRIAQDVGFAQSSSLTRLFRRRDRITPQQYRQQIRNLANA